MELQWPLILFTTLTAWACGVFGAQGVLALKGAGKKSQQVLAVLSCVLLALGGIAVFFHLQHWERIFNGFGHITSGITQELIAIVVFVVVAVAYFVMARKSEDGGTLPKWMAVLAIVISVVLAAVCAHSYMMPARPAWNSVLEVLSIAGAACLLGPATVAVVLAAKGEDTQALGMPAIVGSVIGAVCTAAYAAYVQMSAGSFTEVGYYFDPTHPTKAMVDAGAAIGDQALLLWLGAVVVGAIVPLVCCFLARKKGDAASWKLFGAVAAVAALAGGASPLGPHKRARSATPNPRTAALPDLASGLCLCRGRRPSRPCKILNFPGFRAHSGRVLCRKSDFPSLEARREARKVQKPAPFSGPDVTKPGKFDFPPSRTARAPWKSATRPSGAIQSGRSSALRNDLHAEIEKVHVH